VAVKTKKSPPGCDLYAAGEKDGYSVKAVTDSAGSHVIVSGKDVHKIAAFPSHKEAVYAAKMVVVHGMGIVIGWTDPIGSLWELAMHQALGPSRRAYASINGPTPARKSKGSN
jgi:hypothetical protein